MGLGERLQRIESSDLDELTDSVPRIGANFAIGAFSLYAAREMRKEGEASARELALPIVNAVAYLGLGALATYRRFAR